MAARAWVLLLISVAIFATGTDAVKAASRHRIRVSEDDGEGEGEGSDAGSAGLAAAMTQAVDQLGEANENATRLVTSLSSQTDLAAKNNMDLAKQIKTMRDFLNPPKPKKVNTKERTSDPNKCLHRTCGECIADENCGWCITKQRCVEGDSTRPYSAICVDWTYDACPFDCSSYLSCNECLGDNTCSWCQDDCSCGRRGYGQCDRLFVEAPALCPTQATCPTTGAPPLVNILPQLAKLKARVAAMAAAEEQRLDLEAKAAAEGSGSDAGSSPLGAGAAAPSSSSSAAVAGAAPVTPPPVEAAAAAPAPATA